jgi:hypothetical protein
MIRDGDLDPNWQFGVGALWFDGSQGSVTGPINVTNALIEQSPFEAIQWVEGGGSCTVSVSYTPTATGASAANLTVASNAANPSLTVALTGTGTSSGGSTNLAAGAPITASSYTQNYVAANANDGNTSTYWEGTNGAWPTTLTVNLGAGKALGSVVLDLPPSSAWGTRTQTLSVLGSANGSSYTTLVGPATYTFNPATGNTVTIALPSGTSDQYVQLSFTANSVQNGAQVSELDVFGP